MLQNAVAQYKKVRVTTSNQGELLLALYDGLFRFLNGSKLCIEQGQLTKARELNSKAYAIIAELNMALDPSHAPELCANLSALYGFCLDRLRAASRTNDAESINDVLSTLTPLREAWQLAVPKATMEGVRFGPQGR
jgi:flagellar protein FliS